MRELLNVATEYSVTLIDAIALVVILAGTVEAFVRGLLGMLGSRAEGAERDVWLRYARWLVAGLTFQLAADIVETSFAPTWADVGMIAAIAAIRTFLNYFLERDLAEVRERQREAVAA
jgi:uncharacterized membrane protein